MSELPAARCFTGVLVGFWFGLYPSVEVLLIPMLGFVYVDAAWLFVKVQSLRRGARQMKAVHEADSFAAHPALARRSGTR
jgi:hypothetical protein